MNISNANDWVNKLKVLKESHTTSVGVRTSHLLLFGTLDITE